ncbi:MAG: hypothetical protein R2909_17025 [Gemmatimonadales bacterium]
MIPAGGDREAEGVAVDQGVVLAAELGQREPVHQDRERAIRQRPLDPGDRPTHRE